MRVRRQTDGLLQVKMRLAMVSPPGSFGKLLPLSSAADPSITLTLFGVPIVCFTTDGPEMGVSEAQSSGL